MDFFLGRDIEVRDVLPLFRDQIAFGLWSNALKVTCLGYDDGLFVDCLIGNAQ